MTIAEGEVAEVGKGVKAPVFSLDVFLCRAMEG